MAEVGRPPVLRGRHQLDDVALERLDVELLRTPLRSRSPRPAGSTWDECWCRTCRSSWLGHQSWLVLGRPRLGSGRRSPGSRCRCRVQSRRSISCLGGWHSWWFCFWAVRLTDHRRGRCPSRSPRPRRSTKPWVGGRGRGTVRRRRRSRRPRWHRSAGRRRGGGCRRPASRTAPATLRAGSGGRARPSVSARRTSYTAWWRRVPRVHRAAVAIVSVSACGCDAQRAEARRPGAGHPQAGSPQEGGRLGGVHIATQPPFLERLKTEPVGARPGRWIQQVPAALVSNCPDLVSRSTPT